MSKLIKTNLLRKYHNASDCAYATSSVLDYCLNRRYNLLKEFSPLVITKMFLGALYTLVQVIVGLIYLITGGFLLFPLYVAQHHFLKKELVEKYGVEKLNESAEKLAKEFSEVENEKLELTDEELKELKDLLNTEISDYLDTSCVIGFEEGAQLDIKRANIYKSIYNKLIKPIYKVEYKEK